MARTLVHSSDYLQWINTAGVYLHPSLRLDWDRFRGFHIRAVKSISAGEQLLDVPFSAALDLDADRPEVAAFAAAPPLYRSALLLLKLLPNLGQHVALLRQLPPVSNVIFWPSPEAAGSPTAPLLRTSLERAHVTMPVRQRFRELIKPVLDAAPELAASFPGTGAAGTGVTEEDFMWAASLVMSRCFHASAHAGGGAAAAGAVASSSSSTTSSGSGSGSPLVSAGPWLVPVADLANYHPFSAASQMACMTASADGTAESARAGAGAGGATASSASPSGSPSGPPAGSPSGSFRYYALRDVGAGEEVFITYGRLSDAQLLHTYGFVVEAPPPQLQSPQTSKAKARAPASADADEGAGAAVAAPEHSGSDGGSDGDGDGDGVSVAYAPLDFEGLAAASAAASAPSAGSAGSTAAAVGAGGSRATAAGRAPSAASLLAKYSFARLNPLDAAPLPFAEVRAAAAAMVAKTLPAATTAAGAGRRGAAATAAAAKAERAGKAASQRALAATKLLRECGVLRDSGFTLQLQDASTATVAPGSSSAGAGAASSAGSGSGSSPAAAAVPLEGVAALEALWGAASTGELLARLVPADLMTALQVLLMDEEDLAAYAEAAQELAPMPLLLPVEPPTALLAKRQAILRGEGIAAGKAPASASGSSAASADTGAGAGAGESSARASAPPAKRRRVYAQSGSSSDADSCDSEGGDDDSDEDEDSLEMVEEAIAQSTPLWSMLLTALSAALTRYGTSLADDVAWYAALRQAEAAGTAEGHGVADVDAAAAAAASAASSSSSALSSASASSTLVADVARARSDYLYRACRLVAMREKEVLALVREAIGEELKALAAALREDGSDDDSSANSDSDDDSGDDGPGAVSAEEKD